jgi:hypothetical protein
MPVALSQLQPGTEANGYFGERRSSASSTSHEAGTGYSSIAPSGPGSAYEPVRRPTEYVGYYVGQSPSLLGYPQSTDISPIPSQVGLAIQNGGLSPRIATNSPPLPLNGTTSPNGHVELAEEVSESQKLVKLTEQAEPPTGDSTTSPRRGPLIVDGSINSPRRRRQAEPSKGDIDDQMTFSTSTSEDLAFDTPSSSDENSQDPREIDLTCSLKVIAASNGTDVATGMNGHMGTTAHGNSLPNGNLAYHFDRQNLDQAQKPDSLPWPLGRQLSAVQEVRTPSPGLDRSGVPASPTSTLLQQTQAKIRRDDSKKNSPSISALSPRPNGISGVATGPEGASAVTQSSWQTQKKRRNKKKTVKSENDAQDSGGEILPLDETQRKGG